MRSKLCATYVLPIVYLVPSSQCVPDCIPFPIPYCSQYVSSVFPVFSDCSLCSECVTCGRPPAVGPTLPTQKQSVLFTRFPVPYAFQIVCYLCAPYSLLGSQFPVCSRLYPVPYFPYCSQFVSCEFPVFSDCSLCSECVTCKATSCRANTTCTEIVSFVYSVHSSHIVYSVHSSHIVYSVPSSYWYPVRSLISPQCVPNFPPPPLFPDCSLCSECVTCGRPPAVGPTLPTQKQSVLFTWFPVPSVIPIVSCVPSVFSFFPGVLSVFPIV